MQKPDEIKWKQGSPQKATVTKVSLFQGEEVTLKLDGMESTEDLQSKKSKLFDKLIIQSSSNNAVDFRKDDGSKLSHVDSTGIGKIGFNSVLSGELGAQGERKIANSPPLSTQLNTPLGRPNWGAAFSQRILWMVNTNIKSADIQIYPPELGPIKVTVQVQNDQIQVHFVAQNPIAKEALDQSMSKLREMFEQEGLDLVDVDVKDQSSETNEEAATLASEDKRNLDGQDDTGEVEQDELSEQESISPNIVDQYV